MLIRFLYKILNISSKKKKLGNLKIKFFGVLIDLRITVSIFTELKFVKTSARVVNY